VPNGRPDANRLNCQDLSPEDGKNPHLHAGKALKKQAKRKEWLNNAHPFVRLTVHALLDASFSRTRPSCAVDAIRVPSSA
jgi:hypothetical protein